MDRASGLLLLRFSEGKLASVKQMVEVSREGFLLQVIGRTSQELNNKQLSHCVIQLNATSVHLLKLSPGTPRTIPYFKGKLALYHSVSRIGKGFVSDYC